MGRRRSDRSGRLGRIEPEERRNPIAEREQRRRHLDVAPAEGLARHLRQRPGRIGQRIEDVHTCCTIQVERRKLVVEEFVRAERVSTFSRGMQQRLGLCRTLLHEPSLVVLDEPFNALDAQGVELLERELAALRGRTVLLATHEPERVEGLATSRLALT